MLDGSGVEQIPVHRARQANDRWMDLRNPKDEEVYRQNRKSEDDDSSEKVARQGSLGDESASDHSNDDHYLTSRCGFSF